MGKTRLHQTSYLVLNDLGRVVRNQYIELHWELWDPVQYDPLPRNMPLN
ncbi:MAG: hypothetical protein KY455_09065 [Euryarchaeota archaeon]|nr:hypothetical protein [Euryarchaeota archaeon]